MKLHALFGRANTTLVTSRVSCVPKRKIPNESNTAANDQSNMRIYVRYESVSWPVSLLQSDGKWRLVVADTRQTRLAGSQPDLAHTHTHAHTHVGAAFTATSAYLRLLLEGVRGVPLGYAHFALPADGEEKVNLWRSRAVLESCPSQQNMQDTLSDSIRPSVSFSLFLNLTCAHLRTLPRVRRSRRSPHVHAPK